MFDGNEELSDDKLKEVISLQNQVFLDQQAMTLSAEKIRAEYEKNGYHTANVIPIVQAFDESRNRVTFFIQEGERARIQTIHFEGRNGLQQKLNCSTLSRIENGSRSCL